MVNLTAELFKGEGVSKRNLLSGGKGAVSHSRQTSCASTVRAKSVSQRQSLPKKQQNPIGKCLEKLIEGSTNVPSNTHWYMLASRKGGNYVSPVKLKPAAVC